MCTYETYIKIHAHNCRHSFNSAHVDKTGELRFISVDDSFSYQLNDLLLSLCLKLMGVL